MRFFRLVRFFVTSRDALMRVPSLLADVRVPLRLKLVTLVLALLVVSPLNILGDIPLLGIADDAALLALLVNWFVRNADRHAVRLVEGEIAPR